MKNTRSTIENTPEELFAGSSGWADLKLKYKILLLLFSLISLVSISMIASTVHLSNRGKREVLKGVTEKLEELQEVSIQELTRAKEVANKGIRESNGLAAIQEIIAIARENQGDYNRVTEKAVREAGENIGRTLASQSRIVEQGLDDFLSGAGDSLNRVIEQDNRSLRLLSNIAAFNVNSLKRSSLAGLSRISEKIAETEHALQEMNDRNNEALDTILVDLIVKVEDPNHDNDLLIHSLMNAFEALKEDAAKRKDTLFRSLMNDFHLQEMIMKEALNLVAGKVNYAIEGELRHSTTLQEEKTGEIVEGLIQARMKIRESIEDSGTRVTLAIGELKTALPMELARKGEASSRMIDAQTAEAAESAKKAEIKVAERIGSNSEKAAREFETYIEDSKNVIEASLTASSAATSRYSFLIAGACLILALVLGALVIRGFTRPLTEVAGLAERMAGGDFTRTLSVNRGDEIGTLSRSLNSMVVSMSRV